MGSSSLRAGHWQYQHLVIKTLLPTLVISSSSSSDMSSSSLSSAERGFCRFGRFHFPLKSLPVPQLKYQVNQVPRPQEKDLKCDEMLDTQQIVLMWGVVGAPNKYKSLSCGFCFICSPLSVLSIASRVLSTLFNTIDKIVSNFQCEENVRGGDFLLLQNLFHCQFTSSRVPSYWPVQALQGQILLSFLVLGWVTRPPS